MVRCFLLSMSVGLWLSVPAHAFNKHGHMATGSLAYKLLAAGPADAASTGAADRIAAILEAHPFVEGPWKSWLEQEGAPHVSRAERLFMLAAQWPDLVRSGRWKSQYHRSDWHYVNYPIAAGQTGPGVSLGGALLKQLEANLAVAKDVLAGPENRAIALCWFLHLMGDLHQPLHVVTLVTADQPKGDYGGNESKVRPGAGKHAVSLHSLWDGMGVRQLDRPGGVQNNAALLLSEFPASKLPELSRVSASDFKGVAEREIYPMAFRSAYLEGALGGTGSREAERDPDTVPLVPPSYLSDSGAIATRQLALAGHRIATILKGF